MTETVAVIPTADGVGVYVSDGTPAGTNLLQGPTFSGLANATNISAGIAIYSTDTYASDYHAGEQDAHEYQIKTTDGTVAGTAVLRSVTDGAYFFGLQHVAPSSIGATEFTSFSDTQILFSAGDDTTGDELWTSDGTAGGTGLLTDINAGDNGSSPAGFAVLGNGRMVFSAISGGSPYATPPYLWATDGTADGTVQVASLSPATDYSDPQSSPITPIGDGRAVFTVLDNGSPGPGTYETWGTDGTSAGTTLLQAYDGNQPTGYTALGDGRAVFSADDTATGTELWVTDGTAVGTHLVRDIDPGTASSSPSGFAALGNGKALFTADDGNGPGELWVTDGTAAGTALVADIQPSSSPSDITVLAGGEAVFTADNPAAGGSGASVELWVTDGTAAGTRPLVQITDGSSSAVGSFTALPDGRAVFGVGSGSSYELWGTDGTAAGTGPLDAAVGSIPQGGAQSFTVLSLAGLPADGLGVLPAPVNGVAATDLSSRDVAPTLALGTLQVQPGTEAVQLVDGTLSIGPDTNEALIQRLYEGLLGRSGDAAGVGFHDAELAQGAGAAQVATDLLGSAEYTALHGAVSAQSDQQFVAGLYQGLLGRAPGTDDLGYWTGQLGSQSRGAVAAAIAGSDEAKAHLAADTTSVWAPSANGALVYELFQTGLGREVDRPGLQFWGGALASGSTPAQVAQGIAGSAEFAADHAGQDAAAFVTSLYQDALGRAADQAGQQYWVGGLQSGAFTQADVLLGVAGSQETAAHLTRTL